MVLIYVRSFIGAIAIILVGVSLVFLLPLIALSALCKAAYNTYTNRRKK